MGEKLVAHNSNRVTGAQRLKNMAVEGRCAEFRCLNAVVSVLLVE